MLYFACLGFGYIMVEVGLIGRFTLALANPTVSASILITGMLVFSGLGSLASERLLDRTRTVMPAVFIAIAALLFAYGYFLDPVLDWIGAYSYGLRLLFCFLLIAPPSFLMGLPMATAMTWLARLGKGSMFVWAWGINGCFSVVGAAAVPIVATAFGLSAVLGVERHRLSPRDSRIVRGASAAAAGERSGDSVSGGTRRLWRLAAALVLFAGTVTLMNANSQAAEHRKKPLPLAEAKSAYVSFRQFALPVSKGSSRKRRSPFSTSPKARDAAIRRREPGRSTGRTQTYSDRRSLIYFPAGFNLARPAVIVVFFHGNQAILARDVVDRQQVPRQVAESGLNAVLIAPQFAVDALDSSSGNFWTPGVFGKFLDEAAGKMAKVYGGSATKSAFARLPVILVAYSGGYNAAAFALAVGGANKRIKGVILLDALYAEEDKVADWIASARKSAFFFSAYTKSSAPNNDTLQKLLAARGCRVRHRGAVAPQGRGRHVPRDRSGPRSRRFRHPRLGRRPREMAAGAGPRLPPLIGIDGDAGEHIGKGAVEAGDSRVVGPAEGADQGRPFLGRRVVGVGAHRPGGVGAKRYTVLPRHAPASRPEARRSPRPRTISAAVVSSVRRAMTSPSSKRASFQLTRWASAPAISIPTISARDTSRARYCAVAVRRARSVRYSPIRDATASKGRTSPGIRRSRRMM